MMGLVMKEDIILNRPNGDKSYIQLLFGDITQLQLEDAVDFLFVSAFPGDYAPVHDTLIGALQKNLAIVLRDIAQHKVTDLRTTFNCWVSDKLKDGLPYRRIVCFERFIHGGIIQKLPDQISGIFRAMMPVFDNHDTSVITPLLASGNQGHSEKTALKSILTAACHWIKAGLSLTCLKIVVYSKTPDQIVDYHVDLVTTFSAVKKQWEKKEQKRVQRLSKQFDVCVSYAVEDVRLVESICQALKGVAVSVSIHKEPLIYDHDQVWQEGIFDVMIQSRKIIAVLTPFYIQAPECLEQYNIALCCNRITGTDVLAPFYLKTVDALPSYMTLIQYTECRIRISGESEDEKLMSACELLIDQLRNDKCCTHVTLDLSEENQPYVLSSTTGSGDANITYDVFISYTHRTPTEAKMLYDNILNIDSNLRVFIDMRELRIGNTWQETLYAAIERAKIVVAFISDSYIQSSICREEYNIALARYISMDDIYFLPILIDSEIINIPGWMSCSPLVALENHYCAKQQCYDLAKVVLRLLCSVKNGQAITNIFNVPMQGKKTIKVVTEERRRVNFFQHFNIEGGKICLKDEASVYRNLDTNTSATIAISFAKDCLQEAVFLSHLLQHNRMHVAIECEYLTLPFERGRQTPRLQLIDTADMVVVVLSDEYATSSQHRHELHVAISRQRMSKNIPVLYLIQSHHSLSRPAYLHLLPHVINTEDDVWAQVAKSLFLNEHQSSVMVPGTGQHMNISCIASIQSALHAAAVDIISRLMTRHSGQQTESNILNLATSSQIVGEIPVSQVILPMSSLTNDADGCESLLRRRVQHKHDTDEDCHDYSQDPGNCEAALPTPLCPIIRDGVNPRTDSGGSFKKLKCPSSREDADGVSIAYDNVYVNRQSHEESTLKNLKEMKESNIICFDENTVDQKRSKVNIRSINVSKMCHVI